MKINDVMHTTASSTQKMGRQLHRKAKSLAQRVQKVALLRSGYGEIKAGSQKVGHIKPVYSFEPKPSST